MSEESREVPVEEAREATRERLVPNVTSMHPVEAECGVCGAPCPVCAAPRLPDDMRELAQRAVEANERRKAEEAANPALVEERTRAMAAWIMDPGTDLFRDAAERSDPNRTNPSPAVGTAIEAPADVLAALDRIEREAFPEDDNMSVPPTKADLRWMIATIRALSGSASGGGDQMADRDRRALNVLRDGVAVSVGHSLHPEGDFHALFWIPDAEQEARGGDELHVRANDPATALLRDGGHIEHVVDSEADSVDRESLADDLARIASKIRSPVAGAPLEPSPSEEP